MALATMKETPSFAGLLTSFRLRAGLSQGHLARAARLSRTYVYHLERGQRAAPSARAARALARALELRGADRRTFYDAVFELTGEAPDGDDEPDELIDLERLSALLVANNAYPTHGLDALWRISCHNDAARRLFEIEEPPFGDERPHLLAVIFHPANRQRFRQWEPLARSLVADFKWNTATLTHLLEYKTVLRQLRALPDFRRIADSTPAAGIPSPSFIMNVQHSELGPLALRIVSTTFSGIRDHHIISYVPGDARTLIAYRQMSWQIQK